MEVITAVARQVEADVVKARSMLISLPTQPSKERMGEISEGRAMIEAALKEGRDKLEGFHRDQSLLKRARSGESKAPSNERKFHELMKKNVTLQMRQITQALSGAPFVTYAKHLEATIKLLQSRVEFARQLAKTEETLDDLALMVSAQQDSLGKAMQGDLHLMKETNQQPPASNLNQSVMEQSLSLETRQQLHSRLLRLSQLVKSLAQMQMENEKEVQDCLQPQQRLRH